MIRALLGIAPALLVLAACGAGGSDIQSVSNCVPGAVCGEAPSPPSPTYANVVDETGETLQTYSVIGGTQQLVESKVVVGGVSELYTAEQRSTGISVSYDPRAAVFTIAIEHSEPDIEKRFQDPAHRTYYGGSQQPQRSAPDDRTFGNSSRLNYYESGERTADSLETNTFFYQKPGSNTRYVSLAGYVRTLAEGLGGDEAVLTGTRSAFVFGNQTVASDVPTSGSGRYTGNMLATMTFNDEIDTPSSPRSRFEWISGTTAIDVNFRAGTVATAFTGTVLNTPTAFDDADIGPFNTTSAGQAFSAAGTASFTTDNRGYAGKINAASIGTRNVSIIGSSLEGTFFGPKAAETGGAFRIVGGVPDQRVDIIGSFTGAKPAQ